MGVIGVTMMHRSVLHGRRTQSSLWWIFSAWLLTITVVRNRSRTLDNIVVQKRRKKEPQSGFWGIKTWTEYAENCEKFNVRRSDSASKCLYAGLKKYSLIVIGSAASELTLMLYTIPIKLRLTHVKCHAKFIIGLVGFQGKDRVLLRGVASALKPF